MAEIDGLEHLPDNGLLLGVHVLLEQFGALLFQVLQALVLLGGKKRGRGQVFFFLLELFLACLIVEAEVLGQFQVLFPAF